MEGLGQTFPILWISFSWSISLGISPSSVVEETRVLLLMCCSWELQQYQRHHKLDQAIILYEYHIFQQQTLLLIVRHNRQKYILSVLIHTVELSQSYSNISEKCEQRKEITFRNLTKTVSWKVARRVNLWQNLVLIFFEQQHFGCLWYFSSIYINKQIREMSFFHKITTRWGCYITLPKRQFLARF